MPDFGKIVACNAWTENTNVLVSLETEIKMHIIIVIIQIRQLRNKVIKFFDMPLVVAYN